MEIDFNLTNKILIIFTNLVALWLSFWVYSADKKNKINRGFTLLVIPNLLWIDFYYTASILSNNYNLSLFLTRLTFASAFIFFIGLYYFFIIWFAEKTGKFLIIGKFLIAYELLFGSICAFSNLILPKINIGDFGIIPIFSFFGKITFHVSVAVLVASVMVILIHKYFKSTSQIRIKIQYFLLGIFIFLLTNFIIGVVLPILFNTHDYYYVTNYATIIFLSFTAYAIVKQNLFNIKVVITALFVGLTAILLATDTIIFTQDHTLQTLKTIILISFISFGYSLIQNVKHEMERREKLEKLTTLLETKTHDLSALLSISKIIIDKESDTKKIIQQILDAIPEHMGPQGFLTGFLILHDENRDKLYAYLTTQNVLMQKAKSLLERIEKPYESYTVSTSEKTLATKVFNTKQIIISKKLADFIAPPATTKTANILQKFTGANSVMMVPVMVHDQAVGVLGFTMKQEPEEIDDRIKNLATAFTNHLAIISENSKYLEDTKNKSEDIVALFKLSNIASTSLKQEEVAQKMMDAIPLIFNYLNYLGGILTLYDDKTKIVKTYVLTQNEISKKAQKILGKKADKYQSNIDDNSNSYLVDTIKTKQIYTGNNMEKFFGAVLTPKICKVIQKITNTKSLASVPIISLGHVKGVITFLIGKPEDQIIERDKKIMLSFASQIGVTLENTKLYEEVSKNAKKLKSMNKELKELLESKSVFLSVASHQLRTPVSIAKGMLSMLVEGKVTGEDKDRFIKRAFLGVDRLSSIIHDLLSANAIEGKKYKLEKTLIQIDDLIENTIKERIIKIEDKPITLTYDKPTKPTPLINVDQNKIREILSNLIDNAIQYTPQGTIKIKTKVSGDNFIFNIEDTGIGFDEKDRDKLFQKISRLPNAMSIRSDGTGLGLFLVKRIIESHGGKVDAKSQGLNQGSVFTFSLPIEKK